MNTWKRNSNTQGGKKSLLVGGLILGLVSLCNGMGHQKLLASDLHPTQVGVGRRGNIFAQLTTRQLDSGKRLTQQEAATLESAQTATETTSALEAGSEVEKAAKVEQAVEAITEELNKAPQDDLSGSAPVTNFEEVIPHEESSHPDSTVEKSSTQEDKEDFIDFTPLDEDEPEEVYQASSTPVESANVESDGTAGTVAANDQINNSEESLDL